MFVAEVSDILIYVFKMGFGMPKGVGNREEQYESRVRVFSECGELFGD